MDNKFQFPTEVVDLPSKGLLYSDDSPLSSGRVEIKYMTAKEEDILTNVNYLEKGIVVDKLLQSLIVTKIDYNDLLIGDKNALLVAARILGYGKDYTVRYGGKEHTIDLTQLKNKEINEDLFEKGKNEFSFSLPTSKVEVKFKFLTHGDELGVQEEVQGLKKLDKESNPENSTRLKHMILSVDGETNPGKIRQFVDNYFLALDSRAFRSYVNAIQPDVDLTFHPDGGPEGGVDIPVGISFLWPDAGL